MLTITAAQLDALLLAWMYPLARVLGMVSAAPIFNSRATPLRIRLAIGVVLTVAIAPMLPAPPAMAPGSWAGIALFVQQILIGSAMGITMRIVMAALDIAGEIIGLQMGLSFATFFDPDTSAQTAVLGEFLGLLAILVFLALNGHLLLVDVLIRSFELAPIGGVKLTDKPWLGLLRVVTLAFSSGLLLALPIIAALLITNISLAVLTRAAPQLNIFAIGFPVTSTVGLIVMIVSLEALAPAMQLVFERGFELVGQFLRALPG
ncbi:flagellar biosynthetic protein FliR [Uliginosibacterium sp. TH139]|uniref:flagellar biosynthetic protein FliR n=1 Tax=Uliginosibacterium sp. TH139 TaxID=2067453 RepID=UPI000C7D4A9E|nr:flagellar biosynthetic protein FliR [Uliginosibacterium sp. TH139]PLK47593.1 flagellar biosynthetic protein FliR [Uliginosibacterium sp. TH139]